MIWRKTMRELWLIGVAYLVILELLAVPVLLLWPEIYADLQRSSLFKTIGVDFIKRIGDAVSGRDAVSGKGVVLREKLDDDARARIRFRRYMLLLALGGIGLGGAIGGAGVALAGAPNGPSASPPPSPVASHSLCAVGRHT